MKKLLYTIPVLGILALVAAPTFAKPDHAGKADKVDVCHYSADTDSYHLINISENALPAHLRHGDAQPGDEVVGQEGMIFAEDCSMEQEPIDIILTTFETWPSVADSNDFGELNWQAEGRFGDNLAVGDWELGVGTNTQVVGQFDLSQHVWGDSPVMETFMVEYDADTGTATFTVGSDSTDFVVGTDSAENMYLVARSSFGVGDYVELSNLMVNGYSLVDDVMAMDGNIETLKIEGFDVNSDFTVTGNVEMEYSSTSGSAPAFQLQVSSGI